MDLLNVLLSTPLVMQVVRLARALLQSVLVSVSVRSVKVLLKLLHASRKLLTTSVQT